MKRSKSIVLVFIASISVSACAPDDDGPGEQWAYSTREDCLQDWKVDKYCEQARASEGGETRTGQGSFVSSWYGPRHWQGEDGVYATTRSGQVERVSADVPALRGFVSSRAVDITRGGFGGSAMGRFRGS